MNKTFFLFIILSISIINTYANIEKGESNYIETSITSFDGLPQNDIHSLLLDSYGLMWVATNDGLCYYDGVDFRTFSKGSVGLESSLILSFAEDSIGNLWIGTADQGLYYYMRDKNRFYHYATLFDDSIELNTIVSSIKSINIDPNGVIWAYNRPNSTILRLEFDQTLMKIKSVKALPIVSSKRIVELSVTIVEDQIYMSAAKSIYVYDNDQEQFVEIEQVKLTSNSYATYSHNGWIFLSQTNGIYCFNTQTKEGFYTSLGFMPLRLRWINDCLWISSREGLYKAYFDLANKELYRLDTVGRYENLAAVSITEDLSGGVWLGFIKVGIKRYQEDLTPFMLKSGFGNDIIISISEMDNGDILIGTDGSGAYIVDGKSGIQGDIKRCVLYGDTIFALAYAKYNNMIYLSTHSALYQIDPNRDYAHEKILSNASIRKLLVHGQHIWMATYDYGLLRLDIDSGKCVSIEGLPSQIVRNIMLDKEQNLWICTSKGVVKIDSEQIESSNPTLNSALLENLENHYAIPIIEDRDGEIWYGTLGSGLLRLSPTNGGGDYKQSKYTIEDGLRSNTIKAIIEDNSGALWISTNRGLSHLIKGSEGLRIDNYSIIQSLNNYEFCENSSYKLPSGELLFGGVKGVTYFNPVNFKMDYTSVLPIISDFKISGVSIFDTPKLEKIFPTGLYGEEGAILNYDQNDISIKFAGINYRNPHSNKYKYQLVGFNDKFTAGTGGGGEINYTNLRPGKYRFVLMVTNSNGVWNETICQFPIIIKPPFWATWYAYLLYITAIALSCFLIIRNYHQMMKRRNLAEQAKFKHKQMADMLESRTHFFTNISHEFRTPLTLILSPLQQLLSDENITSNPHWSRQLQTMDFSGKTLMRLVNSFLNYTKQESGVLAAEISSGEFRAFVYRLFEQFQFWAEQRDVKLCFESQDKPIELNFDPYLMEQLVSNLISNAIKYTASGGEVTVVLNNEQEHLILAVKDNGMGIPQELHSEVFKRFKSRTNAASRDIGGSGVGLYLSSKLVELHGGEIWFDSSTDEINHGTTFYVRLPKTEPATMSGVSESSTVHIESTGERDEVPSPQKQLFRSEDDLSVLPTLLIVEDNIELRGVLRGLFSDSYELMEACDGVEGLNCALANIPDIILTDIMMPKMNGLEMCETVKNDETTSHIPVIILSAKASCEDIAAGLKLSADGYCPKPFNNQVLVEMVNSTLANRRHLASLYLRMGAVNRELERESDNGNKISNIDALFMEKVYEYIKASMHNSGFIVNDLCEHLGVSRLVLNKKLKSLVNMTAVGLIKTLRLQRAAELLRTSKYNVSEVTFDVGFNDLKYFRESFKKEFGVLPQEYKEQYSNREEGDFDHI